MASTKKPQAIPNYANIYPTSDLFRSSKVVSREDPVTSLFSHSAYLCSFYLAIKHSVEWFLENEKQCRK